MRAVEIVARGLARAEAMARHGERSDAEDRVRSMVDKTWPEHERAAKQLLRSLKGQPSHVIDAGMTGGPVEQLGRPHDPNYVFDQQIEAMARS